MFRSRRRWAIMLPLLLALPLAAGLGCRRELPELFDRNQPPETYVTAAPVESLMDGFQVHLHWYGRDPDGEVAYYLYAWTDSAHAYYSAWNPERNAEDRILRDGYFDATHLTTKTDSVFYLLANDNGGTARDQSFNVVAVDDKGRRDPVPARLYFTSTVDSRPEVLWMDRPGYLDESYHWASTEVETVPSGQPFACRFSGTTENGYLLGYQWSYGFDPGWYPRQEGDPVWSFMHEGYADSAQVTLRFENDITGDQAFMTEYYKFGTFEIRAKCMDLAGVESEVSGESGAIKPILNMDPDTRLRPDSAQGPDFTPVTVAFKDFLGENDTLNLTARLDHDAGDGFHYVLDDTIPWGAHVWLETELQGWDRDNPIIASDEAGSETPIDTRFQISYDWTFVNMNNFIAQENSWSGRYPDGGQPGLKEDLDLPFDQYGSAGHLFNVRVGPFDYLIKGFAMDHFGRVDGTPVTLAVHGGFSPLVDTLLVTSPAGYDFLADSLNMMTIDSAQPFGIYLQGEEEGSSLIDHWTENQDGFYSGRSVWMPELNAMVLYPTQLYFSTDDDLVEAEYQVDFTVVAHDDMRNGSSAKLSHFLWRLTDADDGSSYSQISNRFWTADGTSPFNWEDVEHHILNEENEEDITKGRFQVSFVIRDILRNPDGSDGPIALGQTPSYLGDLIFSGFMRNINKSGQDAFTHGLKYFDGENVQSSDGLDINLSLVGRTRDFQERALEVIYYVPEP